MNDRPPLIEIDDLVVEIQSMPALRGFSMRIARGAMVSLVGRNGAGKTTLMRSIMGHLKPARGVIRFEGADLAASPRHARAALGIGYMPEDRCLVPQLTVEENILLPLWVADHLDRKARLDFVYGVISELTDMRHRKALLLSGAIQNPWADKLLWGFLYLPTAPVQKIPVCLPDSHNNGDHIVNHRTSHLLEKYYTAHIEI